MAIQTPGCCDSEWQLLYKILQSLPDISGGGGGTGDVVGPAVAVNNDIALFDGVTGKLIKDSGVLISSLVTNTTLQAASQDIGNGVDTISVVFGTAFAAAPVVVGTISRPVAENLIEVNIDQASITTLGFTASLSATTGSANYKLKWMAK